MTRISLHRGPGGERSEPPLARFFLLAAAALSPAVALAQGGPGLAPARVAAIEAAITAEMSRRDVPGLSVAVVVDQELRWSNGYGMADLENFVPAKVSTVYRLGSVAKPITAVAVLQLAEKGRLDLDAPIQKYVPAFPEKQWPVSSRHLLGHLGGVRHYADGEFGSTRYFQSLDEGLTIFKDDPLVHEPGTRYLYTTYGYNLLGAVVEGASGTSFPDYVKRHIFEPAGMEHARPDDAYAIIPHRAQGYQKSASGELLNSGPADTSYKVPGGGLVATADDAARFAMALMGGVLLQKQTFAQMLTRQSTRDGRPTGYGLGLTLAERRGIREAWHTGGQQRVSTVLYMQPDRRVAVAILSNLEALGSGLLDLARLVADVAAPPAR